MTPEKKQKIIEEAIRWMKEHSSSREPSQSGDNAGMTEDEIIERALEKQGIFAPSVQDSDYGDNTEMTRDQIIEKTLRENHTLPLSEQDPGDAVTAEYIRVMTEQIQRRLPEGKFKTCGTFTDLNVACCGTCHVSYPDYDMELIELPEGGKAWVCCAIGRAIYPERHKQEMEHFRMTMGEQWEELCGDGPED
jgi:hypothetical protein